MKNTSSSLLLNSLENLNSYDKLLNGLSESVHNIEKENDDDISHYYETKSENKEIPFTEVFHNPYELDDTTLLEWNLEYYFDTLHFKIHKILSYYNSGNPFFFKNTIDEIEEIVSIEDVAICLLNNNIDPEHLIGTTYQILDLTDFDLSFKSKITTIPDIIKDLSDEIIYKIKDYPELLYKLEPRLFEELVFKILKKMKLSPTLTKQTRDGGADIIAFEDNLFTKNKYLIECKRYNTQNKVTVETVRSLYGVKCSTQASKAIIVTTSGYTKPAMDFVKKHPWELELKDFSDLKKWLQKYWK